MTIEQHIEELRAELKNACDAAERRTIQAERAMQEESFDTEPPF